MMPKELGDSQDGYGQPPCAEISAKGYVRRTMGVGAHEVLELKQRHDMPEFTS